MENFDVEMSKQTKHSINKVAEYLYDFWGLEKSLSSFSIPSHVVSGEKRKKMMGLHHAIVFYPTEEILVSDKELGRIDLLPAISEEITHLIRRQYFKTGDSQVEEFFGRLSYLYLCDKLGLPFTPYSVNEETITKYEERIEGAKTVNGELDDMYSVFSSVLKDTLHVLRKTEDLDEIKGVFKQLNSASIKKLYLIDPSIVQETLDEISEHISKADSSKYHFHKARAKLIYLMQGLIHSFDLEKLNLDMTMNGLEAIESYALNDLENHRGYHFAEKHYSIIKSMTPKERYSLLFLKPREVRKKFFD